MDNSPSKKARDSNSAKKSKTSVVSDALAKAVDVATSSGIDVPKVVADKIKKAVVNKGKPDSGDFFGFKASGHVFRVVGNAIEARQLSWLENPYAPDTISESLVTLPISLTLGQVKIDSFELPLGLTLISGATKAGKSTFVQALMKAVPFMTKLRVVEPQDSTEELFDDPLFYDADAALAYVVQTHYADKKKGKPMTLYVLDSLRAPLFETSGNAGTKGISMPFFTQLTRVSNALAANGLTVLATINPMDDDPQYVSAFLKKLSAAGPSFIELKERTTMDSPFSGTVELRSSLGGLAVPRSKYSFVFDGASKRVIKQEDLTVLEVQLQDSAPTLTLSYEEQVAMTAVMSYPAV